jgi:tetratricopeptide (TPR) repeat protein
MPRTRVTGLFLGLVLPFFLGSPGTSTQLSAEETKAKPHIVLTSSPQNPRGHLLRGRRLIAEKEFEEGISELKKSLELDPNNEQIYLDLARAYLAMKKPEEAEALPIRFVANEVFRC